MRYREKFNDFTEDTWQRISTSSRYPQNNASYPVTYIDMQRYVAMLDVNTPKWRKLVSQGVILNNRMASVAHSKVAVPLIFTTAGYDNANPKSYITNVFGQVLPDYNAPVVLEWNSFFLSLEEFRIQREIAISKAWSNVDVSEVQVLASLGELPETVIWAASLFRRMNSILNSFATKRVLKDLARTLGTGKSVLNEMSDIWLELRYAVRPLCYDMQQLHAALKHKITKAKRLTARGFNREVETTNTTRFTIGAYSPTYFTTIVSRTLTSSANYRAGVLYSLDSNVDSMMSVWGLDQPLESIWELVPFSFIIDWFFSVGDTLAGLTPNFGTTSLASWVTEIHKVKVVDTAGSVTAVSSLSHLQNPVVTKYGSTTTEWVRKMRVPSPQRATLPHWKLNLNAAKLLDLAAIGRSILTKH